MELRLRDKRLMREITGIVKDIKTKLTMPPQLPLKARKGTVYQDSYITPQELQIKMNEIELKKAHTLVEAHRRRFQII